MNETSCRCGIDHKLIFSHLYLHEEFEIFCPHCGLIHKVKNTVMEFRGSAIVNGRYIHNFRPHFSLYCGNLFGSHTLHEITLFCSDLYEKRVFARVEEHIRER